MVGGALVAVVVGVIIFYVLTVIAEWKIFTKAGEAGWKALIPIYNVYILCKIIGLSFWKFVIILPLVLGFIAGFINKENVTNAVSGIYGLVLAIMMAVKLGKSFGKSTGFIAGLVLFPNIFQLILGFGR
ncbi:MAG: hypothetical protein IJ574_02910 [Bacilli bacterium]|nr:hypothetical protein [Bacilli bacterium]